MPTTHLKAVVDVITPFLTSVFNKLFALSVFYRHLRVITHKMA